MGLSYLKATLESGLYGTGGNAPTVSTDGIKVQTFDYSSDRGALKDDTTDNYFTSAAYGGALMISGSIDSAWRPTSMAPLLTSVMGTPAVGVYTLGEPIPAVIQIGEKVGTVEKARDFYGVGVKSVEFTFEAKEFVKAKWDFLASEIKDTTYDTSVTYPAEDPLVFWRASLDIGGTAIYSKSCSLKIDRALDDGQFVLGNFKLYRLVRTGVTDVSGTLGVTEEQVDEIDRAMYGSTSGTSVPADNPLGSGTLTITCLKVGGTAGATFVLPVKYTVTSNSVDGVGEFEKEIEFIIVGATSAMTITVA